MYCQTWASTRRFRSRYTVDWQEDWASDTCVRKYFNTVCSVYGEVNYASIGWKEKILTGTDQKVINSNGLAEEYSRTINYIQIPVFAHLAWGKEQTGFNFFFQAGPQLGLYPEWVNKEELRHSEPCNKRHWRSNPNIEQETKPVEKKFDYGIAAGIGAEWSNQHIGHFLLEARYYYGLGNIYGSSKRDYFGKSNFGNVVIKAAYLFDITKQNINISLNLNYVWKPT